MATHGGGAAPLGAPVAWSPVAAPERRAHEGARVCLEPVDPARHLDDLFTLGHGGSTAEALWTYLGYGPFRDRAAMAAWLEDCAASADPLFFAVVDRAAGHASGMCSYLRIDPGMGVIEIGHIWFAPPLQRTPAATEAILLLMRHAFDLGYRRLEWKCNALNGASMRAARRFGFTYEGTFRQHMVVKGRNRDTAWFSILDGEWPRLRAGFERWLAPENFDADGRQRVALGDLTRPAAPAA
jgi:RimJ/RimL family protein N-acetyltransferase